MVATVDGEVEADGEETGADVGDGFGGFGLGGEFVVVDGIEGAGVLRREVGHDDIGACGDGAFATGGVEGA